MYITEDVGFLLKLGMLSKICISWGKPGIGWAQEKTESLMKLWHRGIRLKRDNLVTIPIASWNESNNKMIEMNALQHDSDKSRSTGIYLLRHHKTLHAGSVLDTEAPFGNNKFVVAYHRHVVAFNTHLFIVTTGSVCHTCPQGKGL